MNNTEVTEVISLNGHTWFLSMQYGIHGAEWKFCYQRFCPVSNEYIEKIFVVYDESFMECFEKLKKILND